MYNLLWLLFICNPACWSSSASVVLFFNWLEHENVTVLCRFYSFFSKFTGHLLFFVFCRFFFFFYFYVGCRHAHFSLFLEGSFVYFCSIAQNQRTQFSFSWQIDLCFLMGTTLSTKLSGFKSDIFKFCNPVFRMPLGTNTCKRYLHASPSLLPLTVFPTHTYLSLPLLLTITITPVIPPSRLRPNIFSVQYLIVVCISLYNSIHIIFLIFYFIYLLHKELLKSK